jgi:hypothetical protein
MWEGPYTVAEVNGDRSVIADFPGCYAFTIHPGALQPRRVLYVGETKQPLRDRIAAYLVDWRIPKPQGTKDHKGKGFVLEARQKNQDAGVYLHWVRYGGADWQRHQLEASLIDYLKPECNDRDEDTRWGLLDRDHLLDPQALLPKGWKVPRGY